MKRMGRGDDPGDPQSGPIFLCATGQASVTRAFDQLAVPPGLQDAEVGYQWVAGPDQGEPSAAGSLFPVPTMRATPI